jgi:hypothetical protein
VNSGIGKTSGLSRKNQPCSCLNLAQWDPIWALACRTEDETVLF